MKNRDRVISDEYSAWCNDCRRFHPLSTKASKVRMWARRHSDSRQHVVDIIHYTTRRYHPR